MTAEELLPLVECESVRSLRSRLLGDSRVKRINRQGQFALREWLQYDEYSGIAEEIAQEIAKLGGRAESQHLIDTISVRYGVKAGSVAAYLSAPMFVKLDNGCVRLREADELQVVRSDPQRCAGFYRIQGKWTFRIRVNSETLRGSGRPLPVAVATTLGCQPGEKRAFKSPSDEIVISWPAGSASGPNIGSIRPDVEALKGEVDDYMFLTFIDGNVDVRLLRSASVEGASNEARLAMLVGLAGANGGASLLQEVASAIGLQMMGRAATLEDVHGWLMQRNEVDLGRLLSLPGLEEDGDIFSYLEDSLGLR